MVGHGFSSEVAQNRSMAAAFDGDRSSDSPKSQRSQPMSSFPTAQSNSAETSIGKKVIFFYCEKENIAFE